MKEVDVCVSGYEWVCPTCQHLQKEVYMRETFTCEECFTVVRPKEPELCIS